jgi:hypothetical protein
MARSPGTGRHPMGSIIMARKTSTLFQYRAGPEPVRSQAFSSKSHPHIVPPGRIFATRPTHEAKSKREMNTAHPTAKRLKISVEDSHTHGDEEDLVKDVLGRPEAALIVWHHGKLAELVRHFPIVNSHEIPKRWPDERFDLIWVLVRQPGAELKYRFVAVPQMLLADDQEKA